jgi:hypothetical protein
LFRTSGYPNWKKLYLVSIATQNIKIVLHVLFSTQVTKTFKIPGRFEMEFDLLLRIRSNLTGGSKKAEEAGDARSVPPSPSPYKELKYVCISIDSSIHAWLVQLFDFNKVRCKMSASLSNLYFVQAASACYHRKHHQLD